MGTLAYRMPIGHEPLNRLSSEIFTIKVDDTQTDTHTHPLLIRLKKVRLNAVISRNPSQNYAVSLAIWDHTMPQ